MTDLLQNLNEPQQKAVLADDGAFLVIAGAGSGKTTALTRRIGYLLQERHVSAHNILAVTFTNKAAGEMRTRVREIIGDHEALPLIGTFHSICVRILRDFATHIGYQQNFTILDAYDAHALVKRVLKEMEISKEQFAPRTVQEQISRAKNNLMTPADLRAQVDSYFDEHIAAFYDRYQKYLEEAQSMDFDDLIRLTITLLEKSDSVRELLTERFKYILVDEYQDTNHAQYKLIKILASHHKNIFVVGDDWQSIYKWRGADISNILNFEKDYPNAQTIKLEQNYRSTQTILDVADAIIKENTARTDKKIWTAHGQGSKIIIHEALSETDEAEHITRNILNEHKESGAPYSDFVVLYRTNAQSRAVEEAFLRMDVPYRIVGGIKFYERKEVKDIVAYLTLIVNPFDRIALARAIAEPRRGIGAKTLDQWIDGARAAEVDYVSFALSPALESSEVPKSKQKVIRNFALFIQKAEDILEKNTLIELITHIYEESGYRAHLLDGSEEGEVRHENIQELLSVASKHDSAQSGLSLFLEEVALASDVDNVAQEKDVVHLMTLHSAKGLEFPIVFITGLEEGLLPHSRSLERNDEMEEERRLMYVGITRAKKQVHLIYAQQRLIFGSIQVNAPSRFLDAMPADKVERSESDALSMSSGYLSVVPRKPLKKRLPTQTFPDGTRVKHPEFGVGIVVANGEETVSVVFKGKGLKKLSHDYSRLTKF